MGLRGTICAAAVLVCALAPAGTAHATFAGQNGKIAFVYGCFDVFTVDQDGSGLQNLTNGPCNADFPDWSPDGTRIAYSIHTNPEDVFVVTADGSSVTNLTNTPCCGSSGGLANGVHEHDPNWSPDGTRVAYWRQEIVDGFGQAPEIWTIHADGTNPVRVPTSTDMAFHPKWHPDGTRISFLGCLGNLGDISNCATYIVNADGTNEQLLPVDDCSDTGVTAERDCVGDWSPDGTRLAFWKTVAHPNADVFIQNSDGTGLTNITNHPAIDAGPSWSPDGNKIVFWSNRVDNVRRIYIMNSDGSDVTPVTEGVRPDWQSIPINAYPRPKGATPIYASLAPAYAACGSPNREHGPPLAFASCTPPTQTSDELTVGTAESSNGKPTRSISSVRFKTLPGEPSTPPDEADVQLVAAITDVYNQDTLSEYTGELSTQATLRITDKLNTPHPGGPGAGTVSDVSFGFTVSCAPTLDPNEGSSCLLNTSADALYPGAVVEGARAIWELGAVEVYDGGADEDADTAADNTLFMKQGIFIP